MSVRPHQLSSVFAAGLLVLAACADQQGITVPAPEEQPLASEAAVIGAYSIPIPADNGWGQPDLGWQPTPLAVPANTYVLIEVGGVGVRYRYNGDCFIGAVPCPMDLDGTTTGPLNDAGASYIWVGVERAGGGGVGKELVMNPKDGTPQTATTSYKLVRFAEPRQVFVKRRITYGGIWDPIRGTYTGYQYSLGGNQQLTLTQIPEPLTVSGPSSLALGQKGRFEAIPASGLQLRIPDGAGSGNFDLITWEFFKSDTLERETWREIWPLTSCTGKLVCDFNPGQGVAGKLRVTAWVEGVHVLQKSAVIRVQDAELELTCPDRVERGERMDCRVQAKPSGQLSEISWAFTDERGHRASGPSAPEWGGTIVVGGTMAVSARINGGEVQTDTQTVVVTAREWKDYLPPATVQYMACPVRRGDCPQERMVQEQDAGLSFLSGVSVTFGIGVIDDGPNRGWQYVSAERAPVVLPAPITRINPGVRDPRNALYMQARTCHPADVESWITEHEGVHISIGQERAERGWINPLLEPQLRFGGSAEEFRTDVLDFILDRRATLLDRQHQERNRYPARPCDLPLGPNSN